jgi:hypothetical protein
MVLMCRAFVRVFVVLVVVNVNVVECVC